MTRTRVRYGCEQCGAEAPQWIGRCADCGEWGTVVELRGDLARIALAGPGRAGVADSVSQPIALADVDPTGAVRRSTHVAEFDRVLGGGFVAGSVTVLGGEPGIGKSTLLLQALRLMAANGTRALLVAAEESPEQVRLRAERIGELPRDLLVVADTSLAHVLAHAFATTPDVLVVDSIQSVADPDAPGVPGSVTQVRDCTQALVRFAKETGTVVILVGHVTKDGALAGPRALEHLVDTVLQFEGDRHHALRMLRAVKHRFGPTGELGIFEMAGDGLRELADASSMLLTDRQPGATGSVVVPMMEGSRPLLVEMQALVTATNVPLPRRQAQSFDGGRLAMLVAVLEQRGGINLKAADVYASVVGGVRITDTGADLGLLLAIASTHLDRAVPPQTVVVGEVGLGGEVRSVPHLARRLAEAARIGFLEAVVPESAPDVGDLSLVRVSDIRGALDAAFAAPAHAPF